MWKALIAVVLLCRVGLSWPNSTACDRTEAFEGVKAADGSYKYMIHTLYSASKTVESAVSCSGTLLSVDWVLMAAHCFGGSGSSNPDPRGVLFVGGKANLVSYLAERRRLAFDKDFDEKKFGIQERRGDKILINDQYQVPHGIADLALVRTNKPFVIGEVKPLRLAYGVMEPSYKLCSVLGWNIAGNRPDSDACLYVADNVEARRLCNNHSNGSYICVDNTKGVCPDRVGGPLVCDGLVWGVASHMDEGPVVFYTELNPYTDWITKALTETRTSSASRNAFLVLPILIMLSLQSLLK